MHPATRSGLVVPTLSILGALAVAVVGAAAEAPKAAPPGAASYYYYEGEKVPLEVEPDTISAGVYIGNTLPATQEFTVPQGTLPGTSVNLFKRVWRIDLGAEEQPSTTATITSPPSPATAPPVKLDSAALTTQAIDRQGAVLADLRDQAAVEWAYPAYRNPKTGTLLLLTPRIIVHVEEGLTAEHLAQRLPDTLRVESALSLKSTFVLELTAPDTDNPVDVANGLVENDSWVRWAEPDFVQAWSRNATPNDPLFPDQWHLQNTGQGDPAGVTGADARLPAAWDVQTGNGSIIIGVVDDGIELTHPDLASRIWTNPGEIPANGIDDDSDGYVDDVHGWDFIDGDNDPNPDLTAASHGTAVAGVAAGAGNNGVGVSGACQNCKLLSARVFNATSGGPDSVFADAITYAGVHADVLNNSWGGGSPSAAITAAIQGAVSGGRGGLGAPTFFSNGNSASGYVHFTLNGLSAGSWTYTWTYHKDSSASAGLDTAFLDNVSDPAGVVEFEGCSGLPAGWTTSGNGNWTAVNDETRASSSRGGNCSIRAGAISNNQTSTVEVTRTLPGGGSLQFDMWPSSERVGTTGPITIDSGLCFDYVDLTVTYNDTMTTYGPFFESCGTWSNQGNPLQDGTLFYPSSLTETISVGGATNFDRRADYAQWGPGTDFVCHTNGGSLGITTTDVAGSVGYSSGDYTNNFGGTSSASPLCAGIGALLLSEDPTLTATEVRTLMRDSARKIGPVPYVSGYNDHYGYGAVSADAAFQILVPPSCPYPTTLDLSSQTVTTTQTFGACDTLTAGPAFAINSPGDVTFIAGNTIVLKNGFGVGAGASFTAEINALFAP